MLYRSKNTGNVFDAVRYLEYADINAVRPVGVFTETPDWLIQLIDSGSLEMSDETDCGVIVYKLITQPVDFGSGGKINYYESSCW